MRSVVHQAAEDRTDVSGVRTASRAGHGVQFFEHDRQRCDVVTRYVREGLAAGQCLVLVLTAEHRELLLQSCRTEKLNVERAWAEQRLVTLDANVSRFSALDELRESVRFNELFTAVLGHDLRNPLGAIMTAAQLATRRTTDEKLTKPLSRIASSGERMSRMITQLLDFTRARVGTGIPLRVRRLDIRTVLTQIVDELVAANPGAFVVVEQRGDACGTWDEDRLAQVFSNLLGNALQHGGVSAGVTVDIDGSAPAEVRMQFHNRISIPSDLLPAVFEPMTGGKHRGVRSQGLGLGLFITREIVKAHGGCIAVESTEAAGTTFTVSLPRQPPKA